MACCFVNTALVTAPISKAAKSMPVFGTPGRDVPPVKLYWPDGNAVPVSLYAVRIIS